MKNVLGVLRELTARYSQINWALADQAIVSGVNFLTGVLLARYLGLYEFGVFTLAWMVALFVNGLQEATIVAPMMSIGSKQSDEERPVYFGSLLAQQSILSLISFALIFIGTWAVDIIYPAWNAFNYALSLSFATFAFLWQDYFRRYFFTFARPFAAFSNDIVSYGGRFIVLIGFIYMGLISSVNMLWIIAGSSFVGALLGLLLMEKPVWPGYFAFKQNFIRNWGISKWLAVAAFMEWASGSIFIIAAGAVLGPAAPGALKASKNIMGITHIMFSGLSNVVISEASKKLMEGGKQALMKYLEKLTFFIGGATTFLALLISVWPELWLHAFYGNEYVAFAWVLRGYALVYVLGALIMPFEIGFRALEYTNPVFWAGALAAGVSLLTATTFVGWFGIIGAVLGLILTEIIRLLIMFYGFVRIKDNPSLFHAPTKKATFRVK